MLEIEAVDDSVSIKVECPSSTIITDKLFDQTVITIKQMCIFNVWNHAVKSS